MKKVGIVRSFSRERIINVAEIIVGLCLSLFIVSYLSRMATTFLDLFSGIAEQLLLLASAVLPGPVLLVIYVVWMWAVKALLSGVICLGAFWACRCLMATDAPDASNRRYDGKLQMQMQQR